MYSWVLEVFTYKLCKDITTLLIKQNYNNKENIAKSTRSHKAFIPLQYKKEKKKQYSDSNLQYRKHFYMQNPS